MSDVLVKKTTNKRKPHEADLYAGYRLHLARRTKHMSQEILGQHLDVSFQQIQKYEKGTNRMSARTIAEAADALGVSPAFFFKQCQTEDGSQAETSVDTENLATLMSTKDALELNMHYANITDPKLRQHILGIMRQLAQTGDPRTNRPRA
ncbi:helix-turn-helix transcriptional regulator [Agrobacterium vitis]|uniref:helix-turn-helix domain-containing protein n=1 Tax=Allorhizobium ampelinum TaxID=3025782 RepID=UPI001F3B6907|nr:helix-turn-helix transcriptional regulator [Allorhizobium ampelinum]MCF1450189.1 helix-turn-helix transcriptional regulator [Allorhizobium ampelinum]